MRKLQIVIQLPKHPQGRQLIQQQRLNRNPPGVLGPDVVCAAGFSLRLPTQVQVSSQLPVAGNTPTQGVHMGKHQVAIPILPLSRKGSLAAASVHGVCVRFLRNIPIVSRVSADGGLDACAGLVDKGKGNAPEAIAAVQVRRESRPSQGVVVDGQHDPDKAASGKRQQRDGVEEPCRDFVAMFAFS